MEGAASVVDFWMILEPAAVSQTRLGFVRAGNLPATVCMTVTVAFFGLVPLVIALGGSYNPFLFGAAMRLGVSVFCLSVLGFFYRRELISGEALSFVGRRLFSKEMIGILFSYFDFAVLALALRWIDASVGAVIYELWPVALIFIVARWTGGQSGRFDARMLVLLFVAFFGVVLVLASQGSGLVWAGMGVLGALDGSVYLGVSLALCAAFVTAFTGFSWVWSHNCVGHRALPAGLKARRSDESLRMFFLLVALFVGNSLAFLMNAGVGLAYVGMTGEWITLGGFVLGVVGGMCSYGVASVLWRVSTSLSGDIRIHAMSYFTPVFSLGFLALVGMMGVVRLDYLMGVVRLDYLMVGTGVIVAANLFMFGSHRAGNGRSGLVA